MTNDKCQQEEEEEEQQQQQLLSLYDLGFAAGKNTSWQTNMKKITAGYNTESFLAVKIIFWLFVALKIIVIDLESDISFTFKFPPLT